MKNLIYLLFLVAFGCSSSNESESINSDCLTVPLGLTIENKNPFLVETNLNYGGYTDSWAIKYYGKVTNGVLNLKIGVTIGYEASLETFYNISLPNNGCPKAINTKQVFTSFSNTTGWDYKTVFSTTFDSFELQQYIPEELLVCRTKSHYTNQSGIVVYDIRNMWIDLANLTEI